MNKSEIIDNLDTFKKRLIGEVLEAYKTRGRSYGQDRFDTWRRKFAQFLDESLPGETVTLNSKLTHHAFGTRYGENDAQRFWRVDGNNMDSYIDSLILDVQNDEYDFKEHNEELSV